MSELNGEPTSTNLSEDTGQLILQRLDEINARFLVNGTAAQVTSIEREDGRQRLLDNQSNQGDNFLITCPNGNLVVEVIQRILVDHFNVPQSQAKSVQKSITVHLQRVICRYISEKLREAGLRDTIPWLSIPETIYERAVERFNQKASRVLNIDLSRCQGDWLVYHALHSGWNNKGRNRNERRRERQQAREQLEEQRFRLSPSPPPSGNDQENQESQSQPRIPGERGRGGQAQRGRGQAQLGVERSLNNEQSPGTEQPIQHATRRGPGRPRKRRNNSNEQQKQTRSVRQRHPLS